jgi:hypothetical protein
MRLLSPPRRLAGLLALACLAAAPPDASAPIPLAVQAERCTFVVPTGDARDKFVLIVGCLARGQEMHRIRVHCEATNDDVLLPIADDDPGPEWRRITNDRADRQQKARKNHQPAADYPPSADPPRQRSFRLFTGGFDFNNGEAFAAVRAELRGIGRHCLVYVDSQSVESADFMSTVDEVIRTFDEQVFPASRSEQARCLDVDRDGRFAILFSGRLARMTAGKGTLSGFVLGSDFYRDSRAPFGNRCDMLYLNTDLRPGPYLRTLIAHEYTHAIVFSEHVFGDYLPGVARVEEENWLNEGLAHLAEQRHAFGWGNLDYRVSAFLASPQRHPLVVADYYGAGLWRDPGCRGATYLLLHTCACGDAGLSEKLVRSNLCGVANLEAATRESFAALFRNWTVSLAAGGIPGGHDLFRPLGNRMLCGVRKDEVTLSGGRWESQIAGTASAYLLLHDPASGRNRVTIQADEGSELQVTLVPLPADLPRLTLRADRLKPGTYRLILTANDAAVTLDDAVWEAMAPVGGPNETSFRPGNLAAERVRSWFGNANLAAGEQRISGPIEVPASTGRWLFKVSGHDSKGRNVSASVEVE